MQDHRGSGESVSESRRDTDEVRWLKAIPADEFRAASRPRREVRSSRRLAASIWAAAVIGAAIPGTAVAPALAHNGGGSATSRALPIVPVPGAAADAFELRISAEAEPDAPQVRALMDRAARERAASTSDEVVRFGEVAIRRSLVETIVRAAEETGVDPTYLMALADKESSFCADVKAPTSSAVGLFQFVAKTWLQVVDRFGAQHGLAAEAASITVVDGQRVVADAAAREHVLGLRRDPYLSAVMAAELLKQDRAAIEQRIGRDLRSSEFYLPHFFGATGARRFLELVGAKPGQTASRAFRAAAQANRPLFFERQGRKVRGLTVAEVYGRIDRLIDTRLDRYRGLTQRTASAEGARPLDAPAL